MSRCGGIKLIIYTDGSCSGNPGRGGYGVVILDDNENIIRTISWPEKNLTTNNREELKAILYVMKNYGREQSTPVVYSDSNYAVQTLNDWMLRWAKNNWKRSRNQIPENLDIIQEYYNLYQQGYRIILNYIKGHNGHKWNEMADKLAKGELK